MLLLLNREVREVEKEASDCEERLQGWKDQLEAAERWVLVSCVDPPKTRKDFSVVADILLNWYNGWKAATRELARLHYE